MRLLRPEHPAARDRAAPASPAARPLLVQSGAAMRLIAGTITGVKFLSMDQRLVSEFKTRGRRRRNPIGGYLDRRYAGTLQRGLGAGPFGRCAPLKAWIDKPQSSAYIPAPRVRRTHLAQVAELVDALVSGTSEAIRGGSSPLLGTITSSARVYCREARRIPEVVRNLSSAKRTRSRPSFFATYNAASARATSSSSERVGFSFIARPALKVTRSPAPDGGNTIPNTRVRRRSSAVIATSAVASGMTSRNSSPPQRPSTSLARSDSRPMRANSFKT